MTQESEHYVTIFDSLFLPQALALIESMRRHAEPFVLWVIAMDDETVRVLHELAMPEVRVIPVTEMETDDLRRVKPGRTRGEYCWTVTPFSPDAVFARDADIRSVTYIDADLWFLQSPKPLFADFESSNAAVLLTEHAYAPQRDLSATSGRFCVQFMTFVRDRSDPIRFWWQMLCVDWCFARCEDGKFGDQKYLDDFPSLFGNQIHIASQRSWCLGPWNCERFPYGEGIFYHFHAVRLAPRNRVNVSSPLPPVATINGVYVPYSKALLSASNALELYGWQRTPQQPGRSFLRSLAAELRPVLGKIRGLRAVRSPRTALEAS